MEGKKMIGWIILFFLLIVLTVVIVWTGGSDSHYKSPYSWYSNRHNIDEGVEEKENDEK
jgi:hypothetical protein